MSGLNGHGLLLPVGLRRDRRQPEQRAEQGRTWTLPNGCEVSRRYVDMGRKGWRHEVMATWTERDDAGEPVQRHDVLWLDVEHQADQLARAAADELRRRELAGGLSGLARRLGLQLPRA